MLVTEGWPCLLHFPTSCSCGQRVLCRNQMHLATSVLQPAPVVQDRSVIAPSCSPGQWWVSVPPKLQPRPQETLSCWPRVCQGRVMYLLSPWCLPRRYMKHKRDDGPEKQEDEAVDVTPVMICVFVLTCCLMLVLLYYFYDQLGAPLPH